MEDELKEEREGLENEQQVDSKQEINYKVLTILSEISNSLHDIKASLKDDSPRKPSQEER